MSLNDPALIFGDFDHDGKRDARAFQPGQWMIVPPVSIENPDASPSATLRVRPLPGQASSQVVIKATGIAPELWIREGKIWSQPARPSPQTSSTGVSVTFNLPLSPEGSEIGVSVSPPLNADRFILEIDGQPILCRLTPVLLTSSLDPAEEVFVVRNPLNRKFVTELSRIVSNVEGKPRLRMIDTATGSSDLWIQDAVEIGRFAYPVSGRKITQGVAPITGLRAKHTMGLNCGPLDTAVRSYFDNVTPSAVSINAGDSLPDRRWIDWFGNLEVSPAVKGFPHGRLLTGDQKGLRLHPEVLRFLELQKIQWPPLFLDVSWLTIGHVDETINFVPAPDRQGFRVLIPSPASARRLLEDAARSGQAHTAVFAGKSEFRQSSETTVAQLLEECANSPENRSIDGFMKEAVRQIREGLSVEDADIIAVPCLFKDGLAVIPNMVNSLVLGRDLILPSPVGPVIEGEDLFQKPMRSSLEPLGLRLHFVDIWEPYHVRSGEIHCGTNAIRRLRNPVWWR